MHIDATPELPRCDSEGAPRFVVLVLGEGELDDSTEGVFADAAEAVLRHPWPGNVRELRNAIERACALESGATISADRLLLETPLLGLRDQPRGVLM